MNPNHGAICDAALLNDRPCGVGWIQDCQGKTETSRFRYLLKTESIPASDRESQRLNPNDFFRAAGPVDIQMAISTTTTVAAVARAHR